MGFEDQNVPRTTTLPFTRPFRCAAGKKLKVSEKLGKETAKIYPFKCKKEAKHTKMTGCSMSRTLIVSSNIFPKRFGYCY